MDAVSPPQYRRSGSELPAYSRRRSVQQPTLPRRDPTEHTFQLSEGKNTPWVTLKLRSSAKSPKSLPTFFEKEHINGELEVMAERGDSIQAITATVRSGFQM